MISLTSDELLRLLNEESPDFAQPSPAMIPWKADGVSTDSRSVDAGQLFIPLIGEHFDGHEYINMAFASGASGVLTSREPMAGMPCIHVPDTRKALQRLAAAYRRMFSPVAVALTGSVGKTTTKELTAAVFAAKYETLSTIGNLNNDIGLPLTLLRLTRTHEAAVLEMGMSHLGEISLLTRLARPDIAIITNIGTSHIGNLGSQENICRAKLEILEGLRDGGTVVLNGDDPFLKKAVIPAKFRTVYFAIDDPAADVRAENIVTCDEYSTFDILWQGERYPARVNIAGRHNVFNGLAAFTAGVMGGVEPSAAAAALETVQPKGMRQRIVTMGGCTVIEDCYNANPDSMRAALRVLGDYKGRRRIALLGDMLELGDYADNAHTEAGRQAAAAADILVSVGSFSGRMADGAAECGMKPENIFTPERADVTALLKSILRTGDVLLVKGSRGMRMEEFLQNLFD